MAERPRVGVFGGTFDPIHIGHLVAAIGACYACRLDRVLMVVAPRPWQKVGRTDLLPAELRFQAVEAAVDGVHGLEASRIELDRGGLTYTVDTLNGLKSQLDADLFLIVGADTAARLEEWREPEAVASMADVVVVNRPGSMHRAMRPMWRTHHVEIPGLDISSTDLRRRLADGRPLDFLVPDKALAVFRAKGR